MYGKRKRNSPTGKFKRIDKIILFLAAASVLLVLGKDVIFQEGNPLIFIKPMLMLAAGKDYVEVERAEAAGDGEVVYLTRGTEKEALFHHIEDTYQLEYKEQNGSGYTFEGALGKRILTGRKYLKYYTVWRISEVR